MLDHILFTSPWLLGFLAALPLLWWLLRLTPPSPRKVVFPALALLRGLATPEQTPARTPWWLLLLRLLIAAILIAAFARPLIDPLPAVPGKGALLITIDNDWAAARDWDARQKILYDLVRQAERESRPVILLPTTPSANGDTLSVLGPIAAEAALAQAKRIVPQPWPSDWRQANEILQKLDRTSVADATWIASGLGNADAKIFYQTLNENGGAHVVGTKSPIYVVTPPQSEEGQLSIAVLRANTDAAAALNINAVARDGNILARLPANFSAGSPRAIAPLNLPIDIRNSIARFEVEGQHSAAIALLDSGWEHRPVGIVGDQAELDQHSLLSGLFYIDRALKPYADLHVDQLDALLKQDLAVIILTDTTQLNNEEVPRLADWIKHGGVLVRFSGEVMAAPDSPEAGILPVALRTGDRALGGTLSWATPQKLRAFPDGSPFAGLAIPPDVTISRQVLAEPSADLAKKTWATLEDGTPLVTAKTIGQGVSVLFHVPARSDWSNLPLSGLFVDMLRRVVELSHGVPGSNADISSLPPLRALDGFGEMQKPGAAAQPVVDGDFSRVQPGPQHPPGLYGFDAYNRAFNLGAAIGQPQALSEISIGASDARSGEIDLQPYLLVAAFILLLGDFLLSLRMRGLLMLRRGRIAAALAFLVLFPVHSSHAATDEKTAVELTSKTYLAYVRTGDRETDKISEAGLTGLARILQRRTSVDHTGITGVDPDTDDLAFFPFLYWPIVAGESPLTPQGAARVNDYLHHGGMILFDAMDGQDASPGLMQRVIAGVDLPPLAKLPDNHVLKRSFYLLDEFPGRFANNEFWLEPENASAYDGVATVLYGSNGWAAAWAVGPDGRPLFPCSPGGEMQRERAFRFGINLVMYALTGNYKSDQLHAQTLLQRLGK